MPLTPRTPSPVSRAQEALRAMERHAAIPVWIERRSDEHILEDARRVEERLESGEDLPLAGATVAVKANIDVAGLRTSAAHPEYGDAAAADAPAVARLRDAGAIILGSANMDQFATGLVGTRSPYGALESVTHPGRVAGGSSSGSAVAVASGIADIALGTDTAGSGRVPASFNGIVGVKASRGLVPAAGVVPASRSYDCVTVFARDLGLATTALSVIIGPHDADPLSRSWPADMPLAAPARPRVGIPVPAQLATLDEERRSRFAACAEALRARGADVTEVSIADLLDAARLLYEGALVAERAAAYGDFLPAHPEGADPTVARIAQAAGRFDAVSLVRDVEQLDRYRAAARTLLADLDALLVPTAPRHPTLDDVAGDPIGVNAQVGTYTNFLNLLDLCGVAVPVADTSTGGFGVTVVAPAFHDQVALDIAADVVGDPRPTLRHGHEHDVVVFGAHMSGLPLNTQLTERGARFVGRVTTAPRYRMVDLPGPIDRPGVAPATDGPGHAISGERWSLSPAALASLVSVLTEPMAVGPVVLEDGSTVTGFLCSRMEGPDISAVGDWRAHRASGDAPRESLEAREPRTL
ncbi:allophanate hydrolase [Demequina aestuarii]|uniref:allophanate hydrolase n=1 Tax=Demequina aestuarii TaxID=327095 RepID=UPI0007852D6E|nr:allophanate hydrolase [Demequina aestuarii]